ncbi:hypothetical protein K440DRAFT_215525 [Wilcoxina mikolae CBS 423.85]|nr:hypothetical protein K440DRAFT_215525 [Wilcoxina mikolae CBS 423.85]
MVTSHGEIDGIRLRQNINRWGILSTGTTLQIMGSRLSRTKVEPAVPNIAHIRRSTRTTEGNRQSTASSESGGKAPGDRTQVKSDCDDGAQRLRDPNRVATKETFDDSQHEVAPCHEYHPELSTKADTKENRISQRNLEAGDGNKPSRGRSVPPNPSRGADRDITARATDQLSGKPSGGDEAAKWKEKYRALKEENQAKHEKLRKSNETLKEACGKARKDLDDERQLAHNTTQRLQGELQHYKRELEELHTSHIRSVNDVGTGLEPISDQEFQKRIRSLHDELVSEGLQAAYNPRYQSPGGP